MIKNIPTYRIRTSDLRMAIRLLYQLQSSALPPELRSDDAIYLDKLNLTLLQLVKAKHFEVQIYFKHVLWCQILQHMHVFDLMLGYILLFYFLLPLHNTSDSSKKNCNILCDFTIKYYCHFLY